MTDGKPASSPPGFALVVTVAILVLLAVIAVGLLTLSTITVRSSTLGSAQAEARANARLALNLALGQLQKHAGDDRRVTIAADQIPADPATGEGTAAAPGKRWWTGVYDSWGNPLQNRPEPNLRAWLVSESDPAQPLDPTSPGGSAASIRLVGEATAGPSPDDTVEVPLIPVSREGVRTGTMAWWTGDQGVKAMIAHPATEAADNLLEIRDRLQAAPGRPVQLARATGGQPFDDFDRADPRLAALTDWPQAALFSGNRDGTAELFHDLTTRTTGLLVDVNRGGFRRDLSMAFEQNNPSDAGLYQVAREDGISFKELRTFYQLYKELEPVDTPFTTGGRPARGTVGLVLGASPNACERDEFFFYKMPAYISLQVVYSLQARQVQVAGQRDPVNRLYLALDPIVTIWNPLDVPVVIPQSAWMTINFFQFPYTFDIQSGRQSWECPLIATLSGETVSQNRDTNFLGLRIGDIQQIVLKPGEVIKVSQSGDLRIEGNDPNRALQAKAGFNYGGGLARPMRDKFGNTIDLPANAVVNYTMRPNGLTAGKTNRSGQSMTGGNQHTRHFGLHYHQFFIGTDRPNAGGLGYGGLSIDFDFGNTRFKPGDNRSSGTPGTKPPGDRIYADRREHADVFPTFGRSDTRPLSVTQLRAAKAPVLMYSYSAKTESESPTGTRSLLRYNPRSQKIDFYALDDYEFALKPLDFRVEALSSWVNRRLETSASGNAYYGGSYDAADGSSFVSIYSVPREPIHSLAALQHSTANGFPFQAPRQSYTSLGARQPMLPQVPHAVGNSFAPGVLAPDETSRTISGGRPVADHSYLANQALWDSWFFSSAAPQDSFGYAPRRDQRTVTKDFLEGTEPLPIAAYRPNPGDEDLNRTLARFFSRVGVSDEAVEEMASLILVDGMFNVNSTSVEAWRILLTSLLGEDIVTRDEGGRPTRTAVDEGAPVAALLTPTEPLAEGQGNVPPSDPEQWTGRRALTEDEITELAEAIVREVRRRGPFLCLSDFVNRRVGTDRELARAGAIQNALDSREVRVNDAYNAGGRAVDPARVAGLPFPEAEAGPVSAGIPGIVKQADLLTPIAPVLSARSDTFLVRAYGEALSPAGEVLARAWCEAQVQRDADYVSLADPRETPPLELDAEANKNFGRRFRVVSFRWLGPQEV